MRVLAAVLLFSLSGCQAEVGGEPDNAVSYFDRLEAVADERAEFRHNANWLFHSSVGCPSQSVGPLAELEKREDALKTDAREYLQSIRSLRFDVEIMNSDADYKSQIGWVHQTECSVPIGEAKSEVTEARLKSFGKLQRQIEEIRSQAAQIDAKMGS